MITITLAETVTPEQEMWLAKNIGPRLHYTHRSIGGEGWIVQKNFKPGMASIYWNLTFENDSYASFFLLNFPESIHHDDNI